MIWGIMVNDMGNKAQWIMVSQTQRLNFSEESEDEEDGDNPEGRAAKGYRRKSVPSALVVKAARARGARHNVATANGISLQDSAVK